MNAVCFHVAACTRGKPPYPSLGECSCLFSVREILQCGSVMLRWMYKTGKNGNIIVRWYKIYCRSQWSCSLRRRSAASRLLRLRVQIPLGVLMFVCCECCVLSGGGLCAELITHPKESYRMWCVVVCDHETS